MNGELDRAPRLVDDLRAATRTTVSELPAAQRELTGAAASMVVRSVRLQRALTDATDMLVADLQETLFLIARAVQRPRSLADALAIVCERLSALAGAPVMCTSLRDGAETVVTSHPKARTPDDYDDYDDTFRVEIAGTGGSLGWLYVVTDRSPRPGPAATGYLDTIGNVLGLVWSGVLHESALVQHVERLERELDQVRAAISDQRGTDESLLGLTMREQEVLALLRLGESNAVIAEKLYISVETVKTHVKNVLRKLGSANRRELIAPRHPVVPRS